MVLYISYRSNKHANNWYWNEIWLAAYLLRFFQFIFKGYVKMYKFQEKISEFQCPQSNSALQWQYVMYPINLLSEDRRVIVLLSVLLFCTLSWSGLAVTELKGEPKVTVLSWFTLPHDVLNLYDFFSCEAQKEIFCRMLLTNLFWSPLTFIAWIKKKAQNFEACLVWLVDVISVLYQVNWLKENSHIKITHWIPIH